MQRWAGPPPHLTHFSHLPSSDLGQGPDQTQRLRSNLSLPRVHITRVTRPLAHPIRKRTFRDLGRNAPLPERP